MNALRLIPVYLSALMLAAHFYRSGMIALVFLALLFPFLLLIPKSGAVRLVQLFLVLGAVEWIRATVMFVNERIAMGQPWTRLAIILGLVAAFTGGSALLFFNGSLRARYKLDEPVE
ncbi:hypothetical protein KAI87_13495 [Myxococcota bacterium]|nr:hypothetical protein [Myxococcota bacterium]